MSDHVTVDMAVKVSSRRGDSQLQFALRDVGVAIVEGALLAVATSDQVALAIVRQRKSLKALETLHVVGGTDRALKVDQCQLHLDLDVINKRGQHQERLSRNLKD